MARKKIKKFSVAPLDRATGSVSDTENVEDKVTNAPSIGLTQRLVGIPTDGVIAFDGEEIPDGYEEVVDPNAIEDITDTAVTFNEGYGKSTGFRIYKQGKRIFGVLNIQSSSNWSGTNADIHIGTIAYKPPYGFYTNMTTADYFWAIGVNGYLAIESSGKILVKVNDVSKKVIKANIEFVVS